MASNRDPSVTVAETVAEAEGIDPMDLETTLYPDVDGDALDALLRGSVARVTLEYAGYEVTVRSADDVTAAPLDGI